MIRGVIEGFYGAFYTVPERVDLIRFAGTHGYNTYLYAPKNDRQHRARWREAYPLKVMHGFAEAVNAAESCGMAFMYSLSPGGSIAYASDEDFGHIVAKFRAFYEIGVYDFALLLDDIQADFQHEADGAQFASYAEAHAALCNRVYDWLQALDPACTLCMCPTDYHGEPSAYLGELGARLHSDINMFYTGLSVCAPSIAAAEMRHFAEATGRRPLLWDNYPVNDLAMKDEMHIGPIQQRDPAMLDEVAGVFANLMIQPEASKVPLLTYADFMDAPTQYDAETSWITALLRVAEPEYADCVRLVSENSLYSCLGTPEARPLQTRVDDLLATLLQGEGVIGNPAADALLSYLSELDEACYALKFRMDNVKLRAEMLPWIEKLELWLWLGRFALDALAAHECRQPCDLIKVETWLADALAHPKRIGGRALVPLAEFALQHCGTEA